MLAYSVIIPVYNAEKYLESCVQSVLQQETESEYEIILVNDGSRDGSPELCDCLARQDGRIRVIHQVNQGVSAARNAGIAAASGEYILFLDSDDKMADNMLMRLKHVVLQQPDMIEFGYVEFVEDRILNTVVPDAEFVKGSGLSYFDRCSQKMRMPIVSCWAASFRRQFLQSNGLLFPIGVSYGEDFRFHMHCLKKAGSVISVSEPLYWYRANEESVTHTPTLKKARDNLLSCAEMYRLFPCALLANFFCMRILCVANLNSEDAAQLNTLLDENSDILQHISGRKEQIASVLYKIFGWRLASKLIQSGVELRHRLRGNRG